MICVLHSRCLNWLIVSFHALLQSTLSTNNTKRIAIATSKSTVSKETLEVSSKQSESSSREIQKPWKSTFHGTPLNCSSSRGNQTCWNGYPTTSLETEENRAACPEYLRWIHEDLKTWKATGISRDMVEAAKKTAHFRFSLYSQTTNSNYTSIFSLSLFFYCGVLRWTFWFQVSSERRKSIRGEVQEIYTDTWRFHYMGHSATSEKVSREGARFGAYVWLWWQACGPNKFLPLVQLRRPTTFVSVLRWSLDGGHCVPWLVFLGVVRL